jgi:RNA polymerase sigma-70 factor (ECF subfamily)
MTRRTAQPVLRPVPRPNESGPAEESLSDAALIEGIIAGDERIATQLYHRLVTIVDRTLYRVFGRRELDHDDLVQGALEQIIQTLSERRFAGACSLNTWASTIASHVGLNALRARRRERRVLAGAVDEGAHVTPDSSRDPEHDLSIRDQIERARVHLAAMDPAKANTLFLHDVLGHDLAEIAVLTGASVAAAQSRLVRARRELRERVEGTVPGDREG